jgi:protoheme IX farnesyltransferase
MNPTTLPAVPVPVAAPSRRGKVADYFALTKPGITGMVAVTAAVGYWVAARETFQLHVLIRLLIGTVLSAAGASTLNQVMERKLDGKMDRTKNRPLPSGRVGVLPATVFGLVLGSAGIAHLAGSVNLLTAGLSLATIFSYLALYTPLKTRSSLCTLVGAVPGALPPVMGWAAGRGSLDTGAAILFMILFFWQLPHFLALAWMYREDYARGGFPMLSVEAPDGASTGRQVVLQTMALIVVSLLPAGFQMAGEGYLVAALLLGTGFLGAGIAFALERSRTRASRLFFASIIYLPLLLAALALL